MPRRISSRTSNRLNCLAAGIITTRHSCSMKRVDESEVHDVASDFGVDHLTQRFENDGFVDGIGRHMGAGMVERRTANGLIFGRYRCASILATLAATVARLPANRMHPTRTPASLARAVAAHVSVRPAKYS